MILFAVKRQERSRDVASALSVICWVSLVWYWCGMEQELVCFLAIAPLRIRWTAGWLVDCDEQTGCLGFRLHLLFVSTPIVPLAPFQCTVSKTNSLT